MIRKRRTHVGLVSTLAGLTACAHTVRDYFEEVGYSYPSYIDRTPRPARLPEWDLRCVEVPEHQAFFDAALAALTDDVLDRLKRTACPVAEAAVLVHPYILMDHVEKRVESKPVAYELVPGLAMQMSCFGTEEFKPGVRFEAARGGVKTRTYRSGAMEVAADGWAIWNVEGSIWQMWNVALFSHEGGRTVFRGFHHNADEVRNLERIGMYPDPVASCDPPEPTPHDR